MATDGGNKEGGSGSEGGRGRSAGEGGGPEARHMEDRRASASRHARAAPAPPRRAAPRAHPSCSGSGLVLVDPPTTAPLPLVVDVRRDEERGARTQLTPTQPSRPAGRAELTRARTSYREEGGPSRRPAELSSRQRPPATCLTVVTDAEAPAPPLRRLSCSTRGRPAGPRNGVPPRLAGASTTTHVPLRFPIGEM
jgi:hypothetical protein